jgi:uncharacterized protein YdeI (YjbR/CyaY-like superfamily)
MVKDIYPEFTPNSREEWRNWLESNGQTEKGVWLIHYKLGTGKPSLTYEEAVREAICFGWIDGIKKRVDDERYAQKYSPRTADTRWSETNLNRVKDLISEGRMMPAGYEKLGQKNHELDQPDVQPARQFVDPPELLEAIHRNLQAWQNYQNLPHSVRRNYLRWVASAKKDETVQRRLAEVIEKLENNQPLGLK